MSLKLKLYRFFSMFAMAVMLVASFRGNALAVNMNAGDLVFVMFGNNTEFVQNLGPASALLAPGTTTTVTIDPSTLSAVSGTNPVNWALVGYNQIGSSILLLAGSGLPPSAFTPAQLSQVSIANPVNVTAIWEAQSSGDGLSQKLLPASDVNSFTINFGTTGTLAGGFPVTMQGVFGSTLSIISGDYNTNALSLLGQGMLSGDGSLLTICSPQCQTTSTTTTTTASTTTTTTSTTTTTTSTTTTTTTSTTTTTVSTLGDVGITGIKLPNLETGKMTIVEVKVKNFGNSSQTRNVSLFLNGVNVGIGQLITLDPGKDGKVKFSVTPTTAGTGTLMASLYPGDSNPSNDTLTKAVKIKEGKGKDKDKDK